MTWHRVTPAAAIGDNCNKAFTVADRQVLIANTKMGLFAVGAICSHQQQLLEGGKMKGCFLFCPLHGIRFDLRDGTPAGTLTDRSLPTYPVTVEEGDILVKVDE